MVCGASFTPRTAQAQNDPGYQRQTRVNLRRAAGTVVMARYNYRMNDDGIREGYIVNGSYQDATFQLEAGYTYAFAGACDNDCSDLDFVLYDPDGSVVGKDTDPDDTPLVNLTAAKTGVYTIRARIPRCNGPIGCYWAVQAGWK
jgi:hypothetical protein